jgi:hypothetical protein
VSETTPKIRLSSQLSKQFKFGEHLRPSSTVNKKDLEEDQDTFPMFEKHKSAYPTTFMPSKQLMGDYDSDLSVELKKEDVENKTESDEAHFGEKEANQHSKTNIFTEGRYDSNKQQNAESNYPISTNYENILFGGHSVQKFTSDKIKLLYPECINTILAIQDEIRELISNFTYTSNANPQLIITVETPTNEVIKTYHIL